MIPSFKLRPRTRQWIRRIHLILAFSVGLVAVVSGLSGSLLVYHPEIDRALNLGLWQVKAGASPQLLDDSLSAVREAFPGEPLRSARFPRGPSEALEVRIGSATPQKVYVDPYTARIVGVRGEHEGLMGTLHDLHVHLLAGETGETAMGVIGLIALLLLATGLVLWWPRGGLWPAAFRIGWKDTGARRAFRLHRFLGIVSIGFLVVSIATGAGMVFHESANAVLKSVFGGPLRPPAPKLDTPFKTMLPASQLIQRAQSLLLEAVPTRVRFPSSNTEPFEARMRYAENPHPNGSTYIALHPGTGRALMVHDFRRASAGQKASDIKYPLHIGRFWGEGGRVLTVFIGLMPALLFVSGFLFWRRRRSSS